MHGTNFVINSKYAPWIQNRKEKNKQTIFENMNVRRIFGPTFDIEQRIKKRSESCTRVSIQHGRLKAKESDSRSTLMKKEVYQQDIRKEE